MSQEHEKDSLESDVEKAVTGLDSTQAEDTGREPEIMERPEAPQKRQINWKKTGIIAGACLAALLVVYLGCSFYFQSHFYFRSSVNGVGSSGASPKSVMERLTARADHYELKIVDDKGKEETIVPDDVDLTIEITEKECEELLEGQNGFAWVKYLFSPKKYVSDDMVTYDEQKLAEKVRSLNCVQTEDVVKTQDATFAYHNGKFEIVEEVYGTEVNPEEFTQIVGEAILSLKEELNLEKDDCYTKPKIKSDSKELAEAVKTMNAYADVQITYEVGSEKEAVPKDTIASWLYTDENLGVQFHQDLVQEFVKTMAEKYNTYGQAKSLQTSYGPTVTVPGGNYGWKIDVEKEAAQLIADVSAQKDVNRDFVYSVKANSRGANDYGDSYVEINLTAQHLYLYKNGQKVLESDFVSGDLSEGNGTHTGAYKVTYKQRDAVLKGRDYRTPVDYWMPFNGGEGMHDANWRRTFGGTIYKTNGSHGCINLPPSVAAKIYDNIQAGFPVLVYTLEGTESKNKTDIANENAANNVINLINGIGAVTLERNDYIRGVRAEYDKLNSSAKKLVTNYQMLVDAENQLNSMWNGVAAELDAQARQQAQAVIDQIKAVTPGDQAAVAAAENAYNSLSDAARNYVAGGLDGVNYYQELMNKKG